MDGQRGDGSEALHVRQLRAFVAVADTLNIGRAAETLGTTQPPVSRLLLRLERRLGLVLFDRHSRGVSLTPAGAALLPAARQVLGSLTGFDRAAADVADGSLGVLRVGTTEGASTLVSAVLRAFRRRRPGVEVQLRNAHTPTKLTMLRRGELDVAFVRNVPPTAGFAQIDLVSEPLQAVVSADHPLARVETVSWAELAAYPLLLTPRAANPGVHAAVMQGFERAGSVPVLGPPLMSETDGLAHIAATDSWTLLSAAASAASGPAVCSLALTEPGISATITLAWVPRTAPSAVREFVAAAQAATTRSSLSHRPEEQLR